MKKSSVQDVDRCVRCHHTKWVDENGICGELEQDGANEGDISRCGCKCEFPSPSVSEAAPELRPCNWFTAPAGVRELDRAILCVACRWPRGEHKPARVHQPSEQNLEDKNSGEMQTKASRHSSVVVSGDSSLDAALTPTPNNSVGYAAAGNLAFLLSVIRCGESLSADEEAHVREVIERLGAISPFPLESDVQKKIVEIRERQARRSHWKQPRPNLRYPDPEPDIDALLSIIDTLRNQEWTAERVVAWLDDPNRAPAIHAFTAGNERQIAYRIERLLANPITQAGAPASALSTTVPGHRQASSTEFESSSESTSVHQPDVQAADADVISRKGVLAAIQEAHAGTHFGATFRHAMGRIVKVIKAHPAASPAQPEVSREQDNAKSK